MISFLQRARTPLLALLSVFVCISLHELGHAVAAYATGGKVTDLRVFSLKPRVRISGAGDAPVTAVRAAGGTAMVVFCWFFAMLLPFGRMPLIVVEATSFFTFIELLAWLLSSLLHPFHPQDNDVGKFLAHSGIEPFFTASISVLLFAAFWLVFRFTRRQGRAVLGS